MGTILCLYRITHSKGLICLKSLGTIVSFSIITKFLTALAFDQKFPLIAGLSCFPLAAVNQHFNKLTVSWFPWCVSCCSLFSIPWPSSVRKTKKLQIFVKYLIPRFSQFFFLVVFFGVIFLSVWLCPKFWFQCLFSSSIVGQAACPPACLPAVSPAPAQPHPTALSPPRKPHDVWIQTDKWPRVKKDILLPFRLDGTYALEADGSKALFLECPNRQHRGDPPAVFLDMKI